MKKKVVLSLSILTVLVISIVITGFLGVQCQLWSEIVLKSCKKIGGRVFVQFTRKVNFSNITLPEPNLHLTHYYHIQLHY